MVRRGPPLWLTAPTRAAALAMTHARWSLAVIAVLLLVATFAAPVAFIPPEPVHAAIRDMIAHGGDYYVSLRDLMRSDPGDLHAAMLPPTLAMAEAMLPGWAGVTLIAAAATALFWIGSARIVAAFARASGKVAGGILLIAGVAAGALLWAVAPHAGWAAILIALALVLRRRDRWVEAAALGCAAATIDPGAILALVVMAAAALLDGTWRESAGWAVGGMVGGIALAFHILALQALGLDIARMPVSWEAMGALVAGAFPGIPAALATPALLLAIVGWIAAPGALGWRVVALTALSLVFDGLFGLRTATLAIVLLPAGLAFAPDALRDLARAALDRRRITVTRIVR